MTEFTFFELHFEEGSIPAVGGLETADDDASDDQDDGSCGPGFGTIVLGFVVLMLAFALARKLLSETTVDRT
ncbi:hypothetical protein [Halorhabdus amylolytica]|uniref:hypothetical protein n=1 Tax=Halorhabdus amylolytica TaxID=2559573 RepID=UPI0010AA4088|nr:hypothetical protein [Halorhabdus amylolytica]